MTVFPICYFPPISWVARAFEEKKILLEVCQYYRKQQYSNRMYYRAASQVMPLIIPVARKGLEIPLKEARLVYQEKWPAQHWRSLAFSYKNAPYFEFLEDQFRPLFERRYEFLLDFDLALLEQIDKWLHLDLEISLTDEFREEGEYEEDLRGEFDSSRTHLPKGVTSVPYTQVFPGFEADLSIWDLMCNLGPESRVLLKASVEN